MARSKIGVDHTGRMNALARGNEATHSTHHTPAIARGMEAQQHDRAILGKPSKAKGYAVPYHSGAKRQQIEGAGVGGMAHGVAVIAGGQVIATSAAAAPLKSAYGSVPKTFAPARPVIGQRSRVGEVGPGQIIAGKNPAHESAKANNGNHSPALGHAILQEALDCTDGDSRRAYGRE
jgi:hypothetical protein